MNMKLTVLERAFELASSGQARNISEIRDSLKREGLAHHQIVGPQLLKQLRTLILQAESPTP